MICWCMLRKQVSLHEMHIHVQLDNTPATNKNNTALLFLASAVKVGLCRSTAANFLRVGHTHEDVAKYKFLFDFG